MEILGLSFVAKVLQGMAVMAIAIGVLIALTDILETPNKSADGRFRNWLVNSLATSEKTCWLDLPRLAINGFSTFTFEMVDYWFGLSEKNYLPMGLFLLLIFFGLPMAILINFLQSDASWLLNFLGIIIIAFILLAFLGESKRVNAMSPALSVFIFAALFLFLPGYLFAVVNGRILLMPTGHALIGSVLIAPMLYLFCHSLLLVANSYLQQTSLQRTNQPIDNFDGGIIYRSILLFIALIPINYMLTFGAFMAGHLGVASHSSEQNWSLLLGSLFFSGLSATISLLVFKSSTTTKSFFVSLIAGLICAYLMLLVNFIYDGITNPEIGAFNVLLGKVPAGDIFALNSQFWVMHLPLVPFLLSLIIVVISYITKGIISIELQVMGGRLIEGRPFVLGGIVFIAIGCMLSIASMVI